MALVKCRECGETVSTKASSCPHCGARAPSSSPARGRFVGLVVLGLVALALALLPDWQHLQSAVPGVASPSAHTANTAMMSQVATVAPAPLGVAVYHAGYPARMSATHCNLEIVVVNLSDRTLMRAILGLRTEVLEGSYPATGTTRIMAEYVPANGRADFFQEIDGGCPDPQNPPRVRLTLMEAMCDFAGKPAFDCTGQIALPEGDKRVVFEGRRS